MKCVMCKAPLQGHHSKRYCNPCFLVTLTIHKSIRRIVTNAIFAGKLSHASQKQCADCGDPAFCYDHRDYSKPLSVEPVCKSCNYKRGPANRFGRWGKVRRTIYKVQQLRSKGFRINAIGEKLNITKQEVREILDKHVKGVK